MTEPLLIPISPLREDSSSTLHAEPLQKEKHTTAPFEAREGHPQIEPKQRLPSSAELFQEARDLKAKAKASHLPGMEALHLYLKSGVKYLECCLAQEVRFSTSIALTNQERACIEKSRRAVRDRSHIFQRNQQQDGAPLHGRSRYL